MTRNQVTVRDKLGDPSSWKNVPEDFYAPNESYLSARLASVVADGSNVVVIMKVDEQHFTNTFEMENDAEAELIFARIQQVRQQVHELLVEVINTELGP